VIAEQETTQTQGAQRRVWIPCLFALGILLVFSPCWTAPTRITHDESILRLPLLSTWRNLPVIFSQRFLIFSDGIYRPLSYGLVAVLRTFVPVGAVWFWHTILIALHGLNVWLVFTIVSRFVKLERAALLAAAVFAFHPLASVLVNNINELHLLMGSTFYFAALASFLSYRRRQEARWLAAALLLFVLGLLTARVVITLPLLLIVVDLVYQKRKPGRETACHLPFLALALAAIGLWIGLSPHPLLYTYSASRGGEWPSFLSIVAGSSYYTCGLLLGEGLPAAVCGALAHALAPIRSILPEGLFLAANEMLPPFGRGIPVVLHDVVARVFDPAFPAFILWSTFHIIILFLAIARTLRKQATGLGLLIIYIGLLPFMTTAFNPVSDYVSWAYLYVPLAGFALFIAALAEQAHRWAQSRRRVAAWVVLCLLAPIYAGQILHLNWAARSPVQYWSLAVEREPEGQTAQVALGKAYLARGDMRNAMGHLFNPSTIELYAPCRLLCKHYLAQGDTFGATMHVSFANSPMSAALLFAAMGALDHAESRLGRVLARNPYNTRAMKLLADVFTKKGFVPDARRWLHHVLEIDPTDTEAAHALDALAREDQSKISAFKPKTPSADWLRFVAIGKATKKVRDEIIEKSKGYPNDPIVQIRAAHCLMENGDVAHAMSMFQKTYPRLPSYAPLASMISWALSAAEKPDVSADGLQRAPSDLPPEAMFHYEHGTVLANQGKLDEAMVQFRAVLQIRPKDPLTHYQLGLVLARKGLFDDAIQHYSKAVEAKPGFIEAMANLGNALVRQGKVDEAIDYLKRCLAIRPKDGNVHYNLAAAYYQKGDYATAWKHVKEAQRQGKTVRPDFLEKLRAKTEKTEKK